MNLSMYMDKMGKTYYPHIERYAFRLMLKFLDFSDLQVRMRLWNDPLVENGSIPI